MKLTGDFAFIIFRTRYAIGTLAYDHVGGPEILHSVCWVHARRKFFQAVELNPQDQSAVGIVVQMDELFEIDARRANKL